MVVLICPTCYFQVRRARHRYKPSARGQPLNEEKAEEEGPICSGRKKHRKRMGRKKKTKQKAFSVSNRREESQGEQEVREKNTL